MKKEKLLVSIGIKAHDLAVEMTRINVRRKRLKNVTQITKEHVDNNAAIRQMLKSRGIS
jgi:DNA-damage-inducible protein D